MPTTIEPAATRDFAAPVDDATIERTAEALRAKGYEVFVADDFATARQIVLDKLPKGAEVSQGASNTLQETGITGVIEESGDYDAIRPKTRKLDYTTEEGRREGRRMGAIPDYWLNSAAALTEDGRFVFASNTGSQLGPIAFGAGHVILVIGSNKIVPDLDTAMRRLEDYVFPLESDRLFKMYGSPSNISKVLILNKEIRAGRLTVVLIREPAGF
ncbi:MAG TPA: lactate utilization protein [Candidatus Limnocylindrales bacterium]|nr:lactate utilization protein [Candidatus Limnocylindrales bacterium]